jgi:hypothetical protein
MEHKRWYDQYPNLKSLIVLLESLDDYTLNLVAQDFLQITLEKYRPKFDVVIKYLNDNPPPRFSRWYDNNYNLHTCIEFVRILEDDEREELVNAYIAALIGYIKNIDNE